MDKYILRTVKVFAGDNDPVVERFFDEKELNKYIKEVYHGKMDPIAHAMGLERFRPTSWTLTGKEHLRMSLAVRPRRATNKYYKAAAFCGDHCPTLKIEITSENLNHLFEDAR